MRSRIGARDGTASKGQNAVMSTSAPQWYSYEDLQRRIREVLGVEVATSTLRAAPTRQGRSRTRITEGLPAPLPENRARFVPVRFAVDDIEAWLAAHTLRRQQDALHGVEAAEPADRQVSVDRARDAGVSWARIAAAISAAEGRPYSAQAAHKRYRRSTG